MSRRYNSLYVLLSTVLLTTSSCHPASEDRSQLSDVATNSKQNGAIYLFWKDANNLTRGRCDNAKPLLRHYCQNDTASIVWPTLSVNLMEGRDTRLMQVQRDESELMKHLAAIDEELKTHPGDADLSSDRTDTAKELNEARSTRISIEAQMSLIDDFLVKLGTDTIVYRMVSTEDRYKSQKPLLAKLNQLFGESSPYPPYVPPTRVPANPTPPSQIPNDPIPVLPSSPAPQPADATAIWTDPVTGKVYIGVSQPQSFSYAMKTCRTIAPGTWEAVGPFLPDVQAVTKNCSISGTAAEGARLQASVLGKFSGMKLPDGTSALVVWSRCGSIDGKPVVLRFGPTGPVQYMIEPYVQLPVICEMIAE